MRGWKQALFVIAIAAVMMSPGAAFAQSGASITGVVKDASGAVLPGVTVEASSPVLIEKVRTAVTDGSGQYRITELLPGTYTVTFALTGFSTVKREGLELSGSFNLTLNVDLKVGNVSETITVTGEPPIVDLQATTRQTVVTHAQVDALPTGRNMFNLGVLIPGVTLTTGGLANQDVGGALGPNTLALGIHGGQTQDQRLTMNGISLSTMIGGGWGGGTIPNPAGVSETLFDTSAVDASLSTGGVRINFIAKDGGNRFDGTVFGNFANDSMQGNNYTRRLKALGLTTPGRHRRRTGTSIPGFGGPIAKDQVVVLPVGPQPGREHPGARTVLQQEREQSEPVGLCARYQPAGDAQSLVAGLQRRASPGRRTRRTSSGSCTTFRATASVRSASHSLTAPEAGNDQRFPLQRPIVVDWTSPVTSKLLLEGYRDSPHRTVGRDGPVDPRPRHDLGDRHGPGRLQTGHDLPVGRNVQQQHQHDVPLGVQGVVHHRRACVQGRCQRRVGEQSDATTYNRVPYSYTFMTPVGAAPTPSTITEYRDALHAQHSTWTTTSGSSRRTSGRTAARRFRWACGTTTPPAAIPQSTLGPTPLAPNRNVTFPETQQVSWTDVTPKMGFAYDLRGNGKTALKISLNKYLQGFGTSFAIVPDPEPGVCRRRSRQRHADLE